MSIRLSKTRPSVEEATALAALGFIKPISDVLRSKVSKQLGPDKIVFSIFDGETNELIGFAAFKLFGSVLYLSGIIVKPGYQGAGVAKLVVEAGRATTSATYLALHTQSTRMWASGVGMTRAWYPAPGVNMPDDVLTLGKRVCGELHYSFPVSSGLYHGALYGEKPIHRNPAVQQWWDSFCSFERGDAVLCIGPF